MAVQNLYSLVSQTTSRNDSDKQSKVQIGYTVDNYRGVLEALQKAQIQATTQQSGAVSDSSSDTTSRNPVFKRWTIMSSINVNVDSVVDGFVMDSNLNPETYRQQQCVLMPYMSFVVDLPDDKGVKVPYYAPWEARNGQLDKGTSVQGKNTFPIPVMTKDFCDSCGIGCGSMENPFQIGLGVDLTDTGTAEAFFQKCYSKIYKKGCAKRLAEKGVLLAEVAFPNGTRANTVHLKVTVEAGCSPQGRAHVIYFPFPLLLTNEFNTLGKVTVNNGEIKTVGQGDCTYPFASSKFNHLDGTIDGFTPQFVKDIISQDGRMLMTKDCVLYQFDGQTKDFPSNACYIRFYLDSSKQALIDQEFPNIPDEYRKELYKGIGEAKMGQDVIGWEESAVYTGDYDIYFPAELAEVITKEKYLKALQIVRCAEIGTPNPKSAGYVEWNVANDGAGITYGIYQTTGKSGGLSRLIELYINDSNSNKVYADEINLYKSSARSLSKTAGVTSLMNALKQAGDNDPNMAFIQSKHLYEEQIEKKGFIKSLKKSGATSPLAFTIALHSYNQGRPSNFWTGVAEASTEREKCNLMIQHELSYVRGFSWWKSGGNHDRWTSDYIKAINNGNFELNQVQRWCNATF